MLVNNPYSQSEIAKLIGTSRPTFNIMMKELENDNYFSLQKGKIIFKK
ncbi:helix-turn-helix domain-containing protein [Flavobacterium branchiophilum]|nr:helix-turn-helix domain-containing protein [Flavobacterium branchiophilum]